jgi:succinate dehydrogenase/fumarate reductase flavoprotein subunit
MERIKCDVLVVGSGGAGLRAAIEAKETFKRGKVVLVVKGALGKCGVTAIACSDRMAFHATLPYTEPAGPGNWKYHAEDIYRIGGYVSDGNLAALLARGSREAFEYLDHLGVPFAKLKDGCADQFVTDGSEYARACYTGPRTANHIEEALLRKLSSMEIRVVDHCMVSEIITFHGRVIGAFGIDEREGDADRGGKVFSCKTLVMATGGAGEAFKVHVFPAGMTGDGYALAYRAGAELVNMEFIQIGLSSVKTKLACSGSMMRSIPRFVNEEGREFLADYFSPDAPLAEIYNFVFEKGASWPVSSEKKTCLIDVAVSKEMVHGHRVFLDYSRNPGGFNVGDLEPGWKERYRSEVKRELGAEKREASPLNRLREINPASIAWLKEYGIDLEAGDPIEIAPSIQHFQGGIKIGERGNATLKGLYAAGECAGGQHGANRPGGNALLDGQVFGKMSGHEAALEAKSMKRKTEVSPSQVRRYLAKLKSMKVGRKASEIRGEIQSITSQHASVVRTEEGLEAGIKALEGLKKEKIAFDESGIAFALETGNLIHVAEMVLRACLTRKESRGPHLFFSHFDDPQPLPSQDPTWRKYIVIRNRMGKMILEKRIPVKLKLP